MNLSSKGLAHQEMNIYRSSLYPGIPYAPYSTFMPWRFTTTGGGTDGVSMTGKRDNDAYDTTKSKRSHKDKRRMAALLNNQHCEELEKKISFTK
eukprot:UN07685